MLRCHKARITKLVAAAAYLLALAVSLGHDHRHETGEHHCGASQHAADACDTASHDHDHCDAVTQNVVTDTSVPCDTPESSDECELCRFLGRPILLVRPFELSLAAERVAPVAEARTPDLQPVVAVVACARAPPAGFFAA